jgi:phosphate transport system protein
MEKHLSTQFDGDLTRVSTRTMEMGGMVEAQIREAIVALTKFDLNATNNVFSIELEVNAMEMDIDKEITTIISRRQPAARDLRLLMAISKTITNLERAGDEATKMAKMVKSIIENGNIRRLPVSDLHQTADMAVALLKKSLDAFARLDTNLAVEILKEDDLIDAEFNGFLRKLVTFMMEDPRTISTSIDLVFLAKSIERIGDHAKNIAEFVIYIVKGEDIRHSPIDVVESSIST